MVRFVAEAVRGFAVQVTVRRFGVLFPLRFAFASVGGFFTANVVVVVVGADVRVGFLGKEDVGGGGAFGQGSPDGRFQGAFRIALSSVQFVQHGGVFVLEARSCGDIRRTVGEGGGRRKVVVIVDGSL